MYRSRTGKVLLLRCVEIGTVITCGTVGFGLARRQNQQEERTAQQYHERQGYLCSAHQMLEMHPEVVPAFARTADISLQQFGAISCSNSTIDAATCLLVVASQSVSIYARMVSAQATETRCGCSWATDEERISMRAEIWIGATVPNSQSVVG